MSEAPQKQKSLIKLGKLTNSRKFDELEDLWLGAVEDESLPVEELVRMAGQVGRLGELEKAESLLWILISSHEERFGPGAALAIAQLAATELNQASGLRAEVARLYRTIHADDPEFGPLLDKILSCRADLDEAVETIEAYLQLRPGAFISDREHLEPGVVEEVRGKQAVVVARFDRRHHQYDLQTISEVTPLAEDHFPALMLYAPEKLREIATDRPVDFVLLALTSKSDNQLSYRDLKSSIIQLLGQTGWSAWWKGAKAVLKRSSQIELSSGSQPTIRLLRFARSYEDRLRSEFESAGQPLERLRIIISYLDESARQPGGEAQQAQEDLAAQNALLVEFGNSAAQIAVGALADNPSLALVSLAVHAAVAERGVAVATPNPNAAARVLGRIADPSKLAHELPEALLSRTMDYVRSLLADRWPSIWGAVLTRASRRLCDSLARGLLEAGHVGELEQALNQVVAKPSSFPEALCWLWRARHASKLSDTLSGFAGLTDAGILTALLELADATARMAAVSGDDQQRKTLEMVQQTLSLQAQEPVRAVFAAADLRQAAGFKQIIAENAGLAAKGRGQFLGLLRAEHAELFAEDDRSWEDEGTIFTTEQGLRRRQTELDQIIKIDIPAVAKQIGVAAAFGDLSENAEYTAALEKRDQLTSRATGMETEIKSAQVITPEMAASAYVNVGCRVRARDQVLDREETYSFLGPWDSDPERGVLYYRAPLALAFMGKKVGEEVVYGEGEQERRWLVLSIEPAV